MPWDMKEREAAIGIDDFDGEVIEAGFVEGLIPAERTRRGEPVVSQQLLLIWRPLDQEASDQIGWYSMGQRGYKFGGRTKTIKLGARETEFTLHSEVLEGPKLRKNSKMGMLLDRLEELGFTPEGANAEVFLGLRCHLKREKYESPGGLEVERETLMPVSLLEAPERISPEELVLEFAKGKDDAGFVREFRNEPRFREVGLDAPEALRLVDKLFAEGKLKKGPDGKYQ